MIRFTKEKFYKDQFIILPVCNRDEVFDVDTEKLHEDHLSESDIKIFISWIFTNSFERIKAVIKGNS